MAIVGVVAAVIFVTATATLLARRYPFELFAFLSRRALRKAGLTRRVIDDVVYWVGGRGEETLVLVHGVNDQAGTWSPIARTLIDRYRLIIPDLPGHGESAPSDGPLDMRRVVDGFAKVLAAETRSDRVVLVGNSMGGWVSLLYAIDHPEKVKKLILEDASGMTWNIRDLPLVPQTREQAALAMRLVLGPGPALPPNYVLDAMVRRAANAPMIRMLQSKEPPAFVDSGLAAIEAPVTMIWGDGDGLLPIEYAKAMQSRIANAKLHVIEQCGHIPDRQKPARFTSLLQEAIGV